MLQLLYISNGSLRKCPLRHNKSLILGRSVECDIVVNDNSISRRHLKITSNQNSVEIEDMNSTNGVFIAGEKVFSGILKKGNPFFLGDIEFSLKEGDIEDFNHSKEMSELLEISSKKPSVKLDEGDTDKFSLNVFSLLLRKILETGLKSESIDSFLIESNVLISSFIDKGTLFILSKEKKNSKLLFQQTFDNEIIKINYELLPDIESLFLKDFKEYKYDTKLSLYSSYTSGGGNIAFVYLTREKIDERYYDFFKNYLETIKVLINIFPEKNKKIKKYDETDLIEEFIVTVNKNMKKLIKHAKKLSKSEIFILVEGESGVGKELFARLIHENSSRKNGKFIALNCAAIPDTLLEAELFGHEKGAFTGAFGGKIGKLELSSGGTLVLDEIGDMPLNLQAKLLRVVQEGSFYRLGGTELVNVDLRIISLTNKKINDMISRDEFREDLYFRLVHVSLQVSPLRERKNDINGLIKFFTKRFLNKENKAISGYSIKAINALNEYHWPGNIRELENEIRKLVSIVDYGDLIDFDLLSPKIQMFSQEMVATTKFNGIKERVNNYEKENILKILNDNKWNKTKAAKELGFSYNTLFKKIKKYNIKST